MSEIVVLVREHENVSVATPTITDLELQLLEASKSGDLDVVKVSSIFRSTSLFVLFLACINSQCFAG